MGYGLINAYAAIQVASCPTYNMKNSTVTINTSVIECNINVQNVTVQNGAKLTLDATNETIINGLFEVKLGSELEIK
ncbi:MAG: peptidase S8, partial [Ignavibacteria bacterium]|nr:peptidase S8 [Ignavibacteria bacterium]